jgi:hypothetical protein
MPSADQLEAVFDRLRPLMAAQAPRLVVLEDAPGAYVLGVQRVREDGYRVWFGAVKIGKRYVSYHLMPVYAHPDLLDGVQPELRRRMQGKSCFNFTRVDESLFAELDTLTRRGLERFAADGLV